MEEEKDGKFLYKKIVSFEEAQAEGKIFQNSRTRGGYGSLPYQQKEADKRPPKDAGKKPAGLPDGIWVQFDTVKTFEEREKELLAATSDSDGKDDVVIYIKETKGFKVLPPNRKVMANEALQESLGMLFGPETS